MVLPKTENIEITTSPLALIVGDSDITSVLSRRLSEGNCEVVELRDFPKSGKFNYVFQFGEVEKVKDSYIKYLKPNGRFLFIDHKGEDVSSIKNISGIKILRVESLSPWYFQKLIDEILKITFTDSDKSVIDIRLNKTKSTVIPVLTEEVSKKQEEKKAVPHVKSSGIVQKKVSSSVTFLFFGIIIFIFIAIGLIYWQVIQITQNLADTGEDFSSGNIPALREDLKKISNVIEVSGKLISLTDKSPFPVNSISSVKNTRLFLEAAERFISSAGISFNILIEIQGSANPLLATDISLSEVKYDELNNSLLNLSSSAKNLRSRADYISVPFLKLTPFIDNLDEVVRELDSITVILPPFKNFIFSGKKDYLLLFQNNMELRATGGFIGSVGFLNLDNGKMGGLQIMDVYTIDGQIKGHIEPPKEFRKYFNQPNFFLRDSNFDPDFAKSALQSQFFLEKALSKKVSGVIGINLFMVQDLLEAVGPVTLTDFNNEVITSDNLFIKAQVFINQNFFAGSTTKKDFLGSVAQALQNRLVEKEVSYLKIFQVFRKSLEEKNLLFYFNDTTLQQEFETLAWAGRIFDIRCLNVEGNCLPDYLAIIESNFGVNKANYFVNKSITIDKKINLNGQLITDLTLNYKNDSKNGLLQGGLYANYLRLFLPKNVTFISASLNDGKLDKSQFDVTSYQSDKEIYGYFLKIPENSTAVFKFSYLHPQSVNENLNYYQLYYQKQPGDKVSTLKLSYTSSKFKLQPFNFQAKQDLSLDELQKGNIENFSHATETSVDRLFQFKVSP